MFKPLSERKYKAFILHFILWGGLLLLNYILFGMPGLDVHYAFPLLSWLIYILLFYLNYILLVPKFLFKKRYLLYALLLFVLFATAVYSKTMIDNHFFKERILKEQPHEWRRTPDSAFKAVPPFYDRPFGHNAPTDPPPKRIFNIRLHPFFVTSLLQLALILLASISLRFIKKWQDDEKIRTEIEKEKISTELLFLKQQINPHFLFNAINSIYSLSISQKPETSDAIIKLSSILRYMLYETDKQCVALNDEIQAINNYIELQKLRLTEKMKLSYILKGNPDSYKVVPLIMLPLIENAFKHGVDNANDSFIDILIDVNDGSLILTVKNRIVSKKQSFESSGIGIKNIIRRLDLLYQGSYILESAPDGDVFKVNLKLKLEK
jgi:two-component system, LytTR family, sensor kinase